MLYIVGMDTSTAVPARPSSPVRTLDAIAVGCWLACYIAARAAIPSVAPGSAAAVGLALLPVLPAIGVLWRISKAIGRLDELHRRVHLEALGIAFGLTMITLWTLGLLELAVTLNRDDWSYRHVWALLPIFYFAGLAFTWRRYK
jgi:hypothetical protein